MKPVIEVAWPLRAEFTKFRTTRGWVIALSVAMIVSVLLSFITVFESRSGKTSAPTGPGGEAVTDSYTFVRRELAGDGTVTTRVTSLAGEYSPADATGTSSGGGQNSQLESGLTPWAKAGIILEPDTRQGTRYAAVMVTGSHGVRMQYDYTHDSPGLSGTVGPTSPRWLRLTRAGDVITGYDSADDVHWNVISAVRLTDLPSTVQIGLFVTSPLYFASETSVQGSPSQATAAFDHISARGDLPGGSWTEDSIADSNPSTWQQRSADTFTISGSGDIAPLVGGEGAATHWSGASVVNGTIAALLFVIVLGALSVTSEYRRGLIRATLAASPRRGQALVAKAVVVGSLAFAAGAIVTAIAEVVTRHVFAANGNYLFPQSGSDLARIIIGTGLFLGFAGALTVAVGSLLRRSAVTVVVGIVLLVVPGVLATAMGLPANIDTWLMRLSPTAAFAIQASLPRYSLVTDAYIPANGYFPIGPWGGLAVLAAYTAAALGAAVWLVRQRDA